MDTPEPTLVDLLYAGFCSGVAAAVALGSSPALVVLPLLIGLVDWAEYRNRLSADTPLALGATLAILGSLLLSCLLDASALGTYFGLVGIAFFLQAVRFVVLASPAPWTLFRQGYPSLVGLSIVCSALADGLPQFRWVTLWLLAAVYAFRKFYVRW